MRIKVEEDKSLPLIFQSIVGFHSETQAVVLHRHKLPPISDSELFLKCENQDKCYFSSALG